MAVSHRDRTKPKPIGITASAVTADELTLSDQLIELGNGVTGTPSGDYGIIIERGSSANAAIIWDESRDEFVLGTTSATGASTGDLTVTPGNVSVERIGAGTEQAEAEVHAKRDTASGVQYSTTATLISEDDTRPSIQLAGGANNIGLIQFGDNAAVAPGQIYYDHSTDKLRIDAGGNTDRLVLDSSGNVTTEGSIFIKEKAEATTDVGAYGQIWVDTATPNALYFTTDAGNDISITTGTTLNVTDLHTAGVDGSANQLLTDDGDGTVSSEANLTWDGGALSMTGDMTMDVNKTDTSNSTRRALKVDMDQTGIMASGQTGVNKGLEIAVNSDSPTMVGTVYNKGLEIDVTGGTSGTQYCIGMDVVASGADFNYGLMVSGAGGTGNSDIVLGSSGDANPTIITTKTNTGTTVGKDLYILAGSTTTNGNDLDGGDLHLKSGGGDGIGTSEILFYSKMELTHTPVERMRIDVIGNVGIHTTTPEAAVSIGTGYHRVVKDVDIRKADSGDNTVGEEVIGPLIPAGAIITCVAVVVKTVTNLSTHKVNIQLSATAETAPDASISSGTEILGAGVTNTDSSDSASASDIDMKQAKEVWICRDTVINGGADQFLYIGNAGTGNGTTDPSAGTLTVIVEYYGMN